MKNVYRLMAMAATVAAFASCSKENVSEAASQPGISPNTLSITVGNETKTLLRGTQVRWSNTDKLKVFDADNGFLFTTTSSDVPAALFTCEDYTGGTPLMAVHCFNASTSTYDNSNELISANLYSTQTIYHKGSYSKNAALAVGKVSGEPGSYTVENMKQCFALLQFALVDTSVVSIIVKGNNGETLAGGVDIKYSSIEEGNGFWTSNAAQGAAAKEIKLAVNGSACKVKNNGAFADTTKYYVSILPQTLSKGVTFVMTRRDGKMATREISSSITLNRAKIKELAHPVDSGLVYKFGNIVVDCTNAANFRYDNGGKEAAFPTSNHGKEFVEDVDFWLKGLNQYIFHGTVKNWSNTLNAANKSKVKLPAIEGYVLSELEVTYSNASAERKYDVYDGADTSLGTCTRGSKTTDITKITVASSSNPDRYFVCMNGEMCAKFILTYTPAE